MNINPASAGYWVLVRMILDGIQAKPFTVGRLKVPDDLEISADAQQAIIMVIRAICPDDFRDRMEEISSVVAE